MVLAAYQALPNVKAKQQAYEEERRQAELAKRSWAQKLTDQIQDRLGQFSTKVSSGSQEPKEEIVQDLRRSSSAESLKGSDVESPNSSGSESPSASRSSPEPVVGINTAPVDLGTSVLGLETIQSVANAPKSRSLPEDQNLLIAHVVLQFFISLLSA
jgi:hypothetical protein